MEHQNGIDFLKKLGKNPVVKIALGISALALAGSAGINGAEAAQQFSGNGFTAEAGGLNNNALQVTNDAMSSYPSALHASSMKNMQAMEIMQALQLER